MTMGDGGRLEPRRVRASVPRDNIAGSTGIRLSRGWLTVALGVGALPVAWLVRAATGIDDRITFAILWAGVVLLQAPPLAHRYDWLAVAGIAAYFLAFLLPAGVLTAHVTPEGNAIVGRLVGYEVLLEPPIHPLPNLPPGELLALAVGTTAWLANPALVVALAFYRHREPTWALVLGGLAVGMGVMDLSGAYPDLAQAAWLAAPALVALAGQLARADY